MLSRAILQGFFYMQGLQKMGVSKNNGIPKWMDNPIKMDDLGVPLFLETPKCVFLL